MNLDALETLHGIDASIRRLSHISATLQWDQETYLPSSAVEERAEQLADIEGVVHDRSIDPKIGALLERLGSTSDNPEGDESLPTLERRFLQLMRKDFDRQIRLPKDFVVSMARDEGLSQAAWVTARKANDFTAFSPHLRKMIDYARRKAEYWGYDGHPYDGLIDEHEPGMDEASIVSLFNPLATRLTKLVERIAKQPRPETSFLNRDYPIVSQQRFCESLMVNLGYDFSRGRLDVSAHPFTTTLGFDDVRITTRYFNDNMLSGLFSVVHETGHALYELGFDKKLSGTRLADGASMGIHESQSRLWENVIGRSLSFWKGQFPSLYRVFPEQLRGVDAESFYRAVNTVAPSLIRVDADEATYSLHILLRFDLERKLIAGKLDPDDLPTAWRDGMMRLLGIVPETDADGVLQDVHWSIGAFGYFPSYALGNLYSAQFWMALRSDVPDVDGRIERGDFSAALAWLGESIHHLGKSVTPEELVQKVCGAPLSPEPFMEYLESKYSVLYGL